MGNTPHGPFTDETQGTPYQRRPARRRSTPVLTAKLAAGAALAILVAGTGVERFTASSGHRSPAGVRRIDELVTSTRRPVLHAPVYAPIALVPAWVQPWSSDPWSSDPQAHLGAQPRTHAANKRVAHRGAVAVALVHSAPASRKPDATPHHSSPGASQPSHSSSSHGLVTVHKVTSPDGTTTTRVTTSGSSTVDGKTTQSTHTNTTVTPPSPTSGSSGATFSSGHGSTPVTSPAPVKKPAPVSAPATPSQTTATPAKARRGLDVGG